MSRLFIVAITFILSSSCYAGENQPDLKKLQDHLPPGVTVVAATSRDMENAIRAGSGRCYCLRSWFANMRNKIKKSTD